MVPFGVAGAPGEAGEKARLPTGDLGANDGWPRPAADAGDGEVSGGDRFSCVWGRT